MQSSAADVFSSVGHKASQYLQLTVVRVDVILQTSCSVFNAR